MTIPHHMVYMVQYPVQKHCFGARDATLHAGFVDVQEGTGRRWRWRLLSMAHASNRVLCGQLRAEKRTRRQSFGDVKLISPNVNVRHRTKRGQSQGIPGRHRRLKKIFWSELRPFLQARSEGAANPSDHQAPLQTIAGWQADKS